VCFVPEHAPEIILSRKKKKKKKKRKEAKDAHKRGPSCPQKKGPSCPFSFSLGPLLARYLAFVVLFQTHAHFSP
jgi:hypothetical protein